MVSNTLLPLIGIVYRQEIILHFTSEEVTLKKVSLEELSDTFRVVSWV